MIKLPALFLLRQLVSFRCPLRAVVWVSCVAGSVALQAETVACWRFATGPANTSVQGTQGNAKIRAFDGLGANINSDGTHFWNYGLNDNSEGNPGSFRRHVLMVAAFRKDMGNE